MSKIRTMVYVDGFNFYYGALKNRPHCKWINPVELCRQMLNENHEYVGLKYFSARVNNTPRDKSKAQRQQIYFRALLTIPNIKIIEGHFRQNPVVMELIEPIKRLVDAPFSKGNKIVDMHRARVMKYEEKGSDVNLAIEILMDAYDDKYDAAVLISNDSDLKAPLVQIKSRFKKKVLILNPHGKNSIQLARFAHFSENIREEHLLKALFLEVLTDKVGKFKKPSSW